MEYEHLQHGNKLLFNYNMMFKRLMCPWFLQELVPLQWEWHRLICPPVFAPWPILETPKEDTCQEEDSQPDLQWQVRLWHLSILHIFMKEKLTSTTMSNYRESQRILKVELFLTLVYYRFEFDVSLEEAQSRKLDVAVKNNKMFFTRERKDIGMVGNVS